MLEECGHEVLVANARKVRLIYGKERKTDKLDAERAWPVLPESIPSCGLTPDERTIFAYATAASFSIACSYSDGLR